MDHPDKDRVAQRAFALWEAAGRPDGEAEHFWYQAERELAGTMGDEASARGFVRDIATPTAKGRKGKAAKGTAS